MTDTTEKVDKFDSTAAMLDAYGFRPHHTVNGKDAGFDKAINRYYQQEQSGKNDNACQQLAQELGIEAPSKVNL